MNDRRILNQNRRQDQSQPYDPMQKIVNSSFLRIARPSEPAPKELYWACNKCGVVAPIFIGFGKGRWKKRDCACIIQEHHEEREREAKIKWKEECKIRTYSGWLGTKCTNANIVENMCKKTFENFNPSRFPDAYKAAREFAQNPHGHLVLCGPNGTGKTHLESAILNEIRKRDIIGLFASAPLFFDIYFQTQKLFDQTTHWSILAQITGCPVLVLDDISQCEPDHVHKLAYFTILDERRKGGLATIFSTNDIDSLILHIGGDALDRITPLTVVQMVGSSYRIREK